MPKKTRTSGAIRATDVKRLEEVWPKLGPFPYLRSLEVMTEMSPLLSAAAKANAGQLFNLIRVELRERSAVTEAEQAFLRILRASQVDDQKQLLRLVLEKAVGMPTKDAEAFVGHLNFETLGTIGGAR